VPLFCAVFLVSEEALFGDGRKTGGTGGENCHVFFKSKVVFRAFGAERKVAFRALGADKKRLSRLRRGRQAAGEKQLRSAPSARSESRVPHLAAG